MLNVIAVTTNHDKSFNIVLEDPTSSKRFFLEKCTLSAEAPDSSQLIDAGEPLPMYIEYRERY